MDGYRIAESFFLFNDLFTTLFIIVSFLISWLALRVYRLTKQRKTLVFSIAFLLIGVSYCFFFTPSFIRLSAEPVPGHPPLYMPIFFLAFAFLYLAGAALLLSTTLKVWQASVPAILWLLSVIGFFLVPREVMAVHIFSMLFFLFIAIHQMGHYLRHREPSTFSVFVGFACLFFANFILVFSGRDALFFTIGGVVQFIGYLAFLTDLWMVLGKRGEGNAKRQDVKRQDPRRKGAKG